MFEMTGRATAWGALLLLSALAGLPAHAATDGSDQKSGPGPAGALTEVPAGVTECDRLAQPTRAAMGNLPALVNGVSLADLRWPAARAACARAMEEAPSEVRFVAFAARAADKGGDARAAARLYRAAADEGYPLAQVNLGVMYENGEGGLGRDDREAARLYRLAADQSYPAGQASLGTFLLAGRGGLRRNEAEAARLWRLAADGGNAQAQNNLGKLYAEGQGGLRRDMNEAARLWRLAAEGGVAEARNNLRRAGRS
ncbi:sel1 repeat family protein [Roseomonas nepalensis]|uniref:Sel1 repeat family protein n=1 Tax=Muricoccus nepalensis TaxID=1854500 RepID=A0A502G259_9PROT|nr:sel1 repeat family protein [Roseomonas nepalensis]